MDQKLAHVQRPALPCTEAEPCKICQAMKELVETKDLRVLGEAQPAS